MNWDIVGDILMVAGTIGVLAIIVYMVTTGRNTTTGPTGASGPTT